MPRVFLILAACYATMQLIGILCVSEPTEEEMKEMQQEEDKRLFYVAISRAMKRLIISGSMHPNPFTPFVRTIIDRFTLRFVRDFENSSFLIEIAKNEMRVFQNGILIRKYTNISGTFNQFDLMSRIKNGLHSSDFIEEIDKIIMQVPDAEIIKN